MCKYICNVLGTTAIFCQNWRAVLPACYLEFTQKCMADGSHWMQTIKTRWSHEPKVYTLLYFTITLSNWTKVVKREGLLLWVLCGWTDIFSNKPLLLLLQHFLQENMHANNSKCIHIKIHTLEEGWVGGGLTTHGLWFYKHVKTQ